MSKPDSQLFLKDKTCKYERMYMLLGFKKNFFLHFYHKYGGTSQNQKIPFEIADRIELS